MTQSFDLPTASPRQARTVARQLLRPDRKTAIVALVTLVIANGLQLAGTRLLGMIVDVVSQPGLAQPERADKVNLYGAIVVVSMAVGALGVFVARLTITRVVERALFRLRAKAFRSTIQMPLGMIERAGISDPLSRMTGDVAVLGDAVQDTFPSAVSGIFTFVLAVLALSLTSPLLMLAALAGFPVLIVTTRSYLRHSSKSYLTEREAAATTAREIHEIADGARTIRMFQAQETWRLRLAQARVAEWTSAWGPTKARCKLYSGSNLASLVSLIGVLAVGMAAHASGSLSLGTVSAATLYVVQLYAPIGDFLDSIDSLQQAMSAGSRLVGVTLIEKQPAGTNQVPVDGSISLRNVHFAYNDDREILHGVNLEINSGERIAVVGPSGAGKSTIAKLIAGIHHPDSGEINVGNAAISSAVEDETQRSVALVTQDTHVFAGSIADNLRLAVPNASDDDLRRALISVGAASWVDVLPAGIETIAGIGGTSLTPVQTQQLALARVLLADPLVVILDEATASFDDSSARGVERSFAAVFAGRTVVTIAHRLDVAATADRVVVVSDGKVDIDQHQQLLADHPVYAKLWSEQQ